MPARFVTYCNDNRRPFSALAQSPYTDIILGFLVPSTPNNLTVKMDAGEPPNVAAEVKALQQQGKRVLVSFGGSSVASGECQQYAKQIGQLVQQLVSFVTRYGLDGVDIDYEDDAGFTGAYDGVGFLRALTAGLAPTPAQPAQPDHARSAEVVLEPDIYQRALCEAVAGSGEPDRLDQQSILQQPSVRRDGGSQNPAVRKDRCHYWREQTHDGLPHGTGWRRIFARRSAAQPGRRSARGAVRHCLWRRYGVGIFVG